jgi:hypothetical protein
MKSNRFNTMALLMNTMLLSGMMNYNGGEPDLRFTTPTREYHSWDHIQLSKEERKGKTYEELQELRKKKYEEKNEN